MYHFAGIFSRYLINTSKVIHFYGNNIFVVVCVYFRLTMRVILCLSYISVNRLS